MSNDVSRFRSHDFLFRSHKRQMRSEKATLLPCPWGDKHLYILLKFRKFCPTRPVRAYWVISAVQFKRFQELMVGIGKLWVEEALYIDHGGGGAGVSQSLGDKSYIEVVLIGNTRPSVSHHIGGKGLAGRDALRQARQVVVVAAKLALVWPCANAASGVLMMGNTYGVLQ